LASDSFPKAKDSFLEGLIVILKTKGYEKIADLLYGSKCTISHADRWSTKDGGTLWSADSTTVDTLQFQQVNILKQIA
jgi:hypothetical protein